MSQSVPESNNSKNGSIKKIDEESDFESGKVERYR